MKVTQHRKISLSKDLWADNVGETICLYPCTSDDTDVENGGPDHKKK